jgi:hypothetical protein
MGRPAAATAAVLAAAVLVVEVSVGVAVGVVGVGVGVVGVGVGVVGVGVGVVGVGVGVVGVGVGVVGVGVGVVGVGVGVVAVGVGVGVVEVLADAVGVDDAEEDADAEAFVADALADALATCTGSHDSLLPVAVAAAALPLMAATTPPEAAVSRALPAIKVTARRRPCAIQIPNHIDQYHSESRHYRESLIGTSVRLRTVRQRLGAKPDIGLAFDER